jgi:hypothetical protein
MYNIHTAARKVMQKNGGKFPGQPQHMYFGRDIVKSAQMSTQILSFHQTNSRYFLSFSFLGYPPELHAKLGPT